MEAHCDEGDCHEGGRTTRGTRHAVGRRFRDDRRDRWADHLQAEDGTCLKLPKDRPRRPLELVASRRALIALLAAWAFSLGVRAIWEVPAVVVVLTTAGAIPLIYWALARLPHGSAGGGTAAGGFAPSAYGAGWTMWARSWTARRKAALAGSVVLAGAGVALSDAGLGAAAAISFVLGIGLLAATPLPRMPWAGKYDAAERPVWRELVDLRMAHVEGRRRVADARAERFTRPTPRQSHIHREPDPDAGERPKD